MFSEESSFSKWQLAAHWSGKQSYLNADKFYRPLEKTNVIDQWNRTVVLKNLIVSILAKSLPGESKRTNV